MLRTARLILRRWHDGDLAPFAAINSDPEVMEHFPSTMSEDETARMIARLEAHFDQHGFGLWAVEHGLTGQFIGFTGLSIPRFESHFTPAVEVGWRLAREQWGNGYALEAARAAMAFGFEEAGLDEIVSFALRSNTRSTRVMKRLGMTNNPADDFDHPMFLDNPRLSRHVLYRMSREHWAELNATTGRY